MQSNVGEAPSILHSSKPRPLPSSTPTKDIHTTYDDSTLSSALLEEIIYDNENAHVVHLSIRLTDVTPLKETLWRLENLCTSI